jgi:hypothetical protein
MVVLSIALLIPGATPVLADTEPTAELEPIRLGLAIRAPGVAAVGQPVTMMTVERRSHRAVAEVDIYALTIDLIKKITAETTEKDYSSLLKQYTTAATEHGAFIGTTDQNGKLTYKFENLGKYILIAIKDDYRPGFGRISIEETVQRALKIRVPSKARVGQPVKIMVLERFSVEPLPVAGASVYAFQINNLEIAELKKTVISADVNKNQLVEKYTALAREKGALIGQTNNDGIVVHTFSNPGLYVLIAVKDGYIPGFSRIWIYQTILKTLKVRNPLTAQVGNEFTITVFEGFTPRPIEPTTVPSNKEDASTSNTSSKPLQIQSVQAVKANKSIAALSAVAVAPGQTKPAIRVNTAQAIVLKPVASARVYTVKVDGTSLSKETLNVSGTESNEAIEKYIERIKANSILIGTTNERGQVVHAFRSAGSYIIVAIKGGYYPGRSKINIVNQVKTALLIHARSIAVVKQPTTILVTERSPISTVPDIRPVPSPSDNVTLSTQILKPTPTIEARPAGQKPVPDADVYALSIQSLSQTIESNVAITEKSL